MISRYGRTWARPGQSSCLGRGEASRSKPRQIDVKILTKDRDIHEHHSIGGWGCIELLLRCRFRFLLRLTNTAQAMHLNEIAGDEELWRATMWSRLAIVRSHHLHYEEDETHKENEPANGHYRIRCHHQASICHEMIH